MRKLAQALGVEAMSLYHHVANKSDILDGMVDLVFAEIELPVDEADWTTAMRARADLAALGAAPPPVGDRHHGIAGAHPGRPRCAITTR